MNAVHLNIVPYQDKYIIYRPLLRLAFIGNHAMAKLSARVHESPDSPVTAEEQPARDFLESVGFLENDPSFLDDETDSQIFRPTVCVLFPTTRCNLRCVYCYAHGGDNAPDVMSLDMARAAIDRVCQNALDQGVDQYTLCFHGGGEPTTAWGLLRDCVAYARQTRLPARITLTSNGVWSDRQRNWLLENIDEISLSFDGPPEIQNRQRPLRTGGPSHDTVMATVRELNRRDKPYGIRVTVTDDSIDRLPDMVTFLCRETHANAFQVEPAFNHGRARKENRALMENDRFAEAFLAGYDIAARHDRHMYYSGSRPWLLTTRFCEAFSKALIVGPDGFLTACYEVCGTTHELAGDFIFGDLNPEGTLSVNRQIRDRFLARIRERRQTCRNCFCYFHCAGDCPSKTFSNEDGGHLAHGSRCDLNRTITKELIARYILEGDGIWKCEPTGCYRSVEPVR